MADTITDTQIILFLIVGFLGGLIVGYALYLEQDLKRKIERDAFLLEAKMKELFK